MKNQTKWSICIIGGFLIQLIISCNSNTPIPKNKISFVGTWRSDSGIVIIINENGTGSLKQNISHGIKDYKNLGIAVAPDFVNDLQIKFKDDKNFSISKQFYFSKEYIIGIQPYSESGQYKMMLNGITLLRDK
jgi:hypothetical protein